MSRELTSYEIASRANSARISATHMPYFRSFSGLETRLPPTPPLEPITWVKLTRDETKAKALAHKLKECDTMQTEIDDLTRYKNYIALIRKQQQQGLLPTNCLLPVYPSKEERTSKKERTSKRRTRSAQGGQRKIRRRRKKTKRAKKLN